MNLIQSLKATGARISNVTVSIRQDDGTAVRKIDVPGASLDVLTDRKLRHDLIATSGKVLTVQAPKDEETGETGSCQTPSIDLVIGLVHGAGDLASVARYLDAQDNDGSGLEEIANAAMARCESQREHAERTRAALLAASAKSAAAIEAAVTETMNA